MNPRTTSWALGAIVALASGPAAAEERPGSRGTVTIYGPDATSVLRVVPCTMNGPLPAYATCTREAVNATTHELCLDRRAGRHRFFVQVADRNKTEHSVTCK
jgi:hypothetical protein